MFNAFLKFFVPGTKCWFVAEHVFISILDLFHLAVQSIHKISRQMNRSAKKLFENCLVWSYTERAAQPIVVLKLLAIFFLFLELSCTLNV